jgi:gp32 DNA binding protein like
MSNLVQYGGYSEEAAKAEQEEAEKGSTDFMKFAAGKNVVRILPPPIGRSSPFQVVHQHFVQLDGMTAQASFNCPRMMAKRSCPVCGMVDKLRASGNPVDYDRAGDLLPKLRVYCAVIDRAKPEQGPRVLAFGKSVHKVLTAIREEGDFTHPTDGFDIIVNRKGTGKTDTEYDTRAARSNSPLAETVEQMNDWIKGQPDVTMYGRVPSDDDLRRILNLSDAAPRRPDAKGVRQAPARTAQDDVLDGEIE